VIAVNIPLVQSVDKYILAMQDWRGNYMKKYTKASKKKHRGQHGPDCFGCKIQSVGFDRSKIRAVPKEGK